MSASTVHPAQHPLHQHDWYQQRYEQETRTDQRLAIFISFFITLFLHGMMRWWFVEDYEQVWKLFYLTYAWYGFNYWLTGRINLLTYFIYDSLMIGVAIYLLTAVFSPIALFQSLFLVLGIRAHLAFRYRVRSIYMVYGYFISILVIGYSTHFALPFSLPFIPSRSLAETLGNINLLYQMPLLLLLMRTTIHRAQRDNKLLRRFQEHQDALTAQSQTLKQELAKRQVMLEQVFEHSFDAQFLVEDASLRILDCNEQALALFEIVNKNAFLSDPDNPLQAHLKQIQQQSIQASTLRNVGMLKIETQYHTLTGRKFWGIMAIRRFSLGGRYYQIARVADITVRKEAEQALQEKNKELKRYIDSNLQLENFAYVASHDLREPLRSIIAFAQLIQRRHAEDMDSSGQEFLTHIISSGQHMHQLIRALLAYSRVNSDRVSFQDIDVSHLLQHVLDDLSSLILEKNAVIHLEAMPGTIWGDPVRLRQLWQNLISNALKFSDLERPPEIWLRGELRGNDWHFEVADNGIGIDPVYGERIFLIFKRLHGRESYEGSGIGLALCRRIVTQHEGRIWVNPREGGGSIFSFTLACPRITNSLDPMAHAIDPNS